MPIKQHQLYNKLFVDSLEVYGANKIKKSKFISLVNRINSNYEKKSTCLILDVKLINLKKI